MLETIKSRCIEFKIVLKEKSRNQIISYLFNYFNQKLILDKDIIKTTPGNFLKFNYIMEKNNINLDNYFLDNLNLILNLYKKEKDIFYINFIMFFIDYYFKNIELININDNKSLVEKRLFVIKNINDYFFYNLNQNNLLNALKEQLPNE